MSSTPNAIRIHNLDKNYRQTIAVKDLSLAVPRGCVFGFLGPNGSGKSTTIGCLTGLLEATAGTIEILGERMTVNNVGLKRRIGVMPETLGLFDPLYGHEFLAFVARMYSVSENDTRRRVTELLAALGLTDARKMIGEYSTGMRKRLAFAAAVIHSPDVLFLDEPFESIDPAGLAAMKKWLRRFTEQGRTVFITSHVLDTVERFCDRVAVVTKPGRLLWEGDLAVLRGVGELMHEGKVFRSLESLSLV